MSRPIASQRRPLFDGSELSVTFVRTALGPNAGPGLDVVQLGETTERRDSSPFARVTRFAPLPVGSSLSEQMHFGDPVVLLRAPFRLSFAYAGPDRVWKSTWQDADKLPAMIRLTVRDAASERVLSVSTVTPVHVQIPSDCTQAGRQLRRQGRKTKKDVRKCTDGQGRHAGAGRHAMTRIRSGAPSSERGFVIVAVLWILMALSALAMIFSAYLSASAQALAVGDTALQTEALVSASLELTAYQLTLTDDKARPRTGSFHFRMDDADVVVSFTSEAARIDLNFAPKEMLARSVRRARRQQGRPPRTTPTGSSAGGPVPRPAAPMMRKPCMAQPG